MLLLRPIMKRCSTCKTIFPYINFFRNKSQPDGFQNTCKQCHKRYNATPAMQLCRIRASKSPRGRMLDAERHKRYNSTEKGKNTALRNAYKSMAHFPERWKARRAVNNAVRSGEIPRVKSLPCLQCSQPAAHYHQIGRA